MRQLAIETSGTACSVALFEDGEVLAARHEVIGRGHAEVLIPWIAEMPDGGRADAILVGCGPGSFTGVRVGIAAARALGLGWGVPVTGLSSLALMAAGVGGSGSLLIAIEGGHGELFCQQFGLDALEPVGPVESLTAEAAAAKFDEERILGNGAARIIAARGSGTALEGEANAALALSLAEPLRMLPPSPIYGRGPDAKPMA